MKVKVWKFVGLLLAIIFALSAANMVHAVEVTAVVPVGANPEGIACDSGLNEIFVANYGSNTVSVISDSNNTVVATVPVGTEPTGVAYDSGKGEIFVTNDGSGTVSVISDHKNIVIANVTVGANPLGVAYDSGKGEIFVANWGSDTVSVISDSSNNVVATVPTGTNFIGPLSFSPTGSPEPIGVAYDLAKGEIYVVNSYPHSSLGGTVSVISDSNNTVLASVLVGGDPYYAAYDFGKGEVFVTNDGDDFVSVISDSTNAVVANVTLPKGAYGSWGIAYDSAKSELFVVNQYGAVYVLSDSPNAFVETVNLSNSTLNVGNTHCVAYDAVKNDLFITNEGGGSVLVLSDSSGASASPSPTVPEFSGAGFILMGAAVVAMTLCGVALAKRKSTQARSDIK